MKPFISIIVPVYNSQNTLNRCVDSIINQSFTDWELLLIDDGSKDVSGKICDEYAAKDCRIKVFHKVNGGVGSARNIGLDNAIGKWIIFVDSDDFIESNIFLELNFSDNIDLYVYGVQIINEGRKILPPEMLICVNDVKLLDKYLYEIYFTTPWSKIYKRNIINEYNLRFDIELKIGEDTDFVFRYLYYVNTIKLIPNFFYNFFNDENNKNLKYSLNAYEFVIHSKKIKSSIMNFSEKTNTFFPITISLLFRYYSHLFYIHLISITSYNKFKDEIKIYRNSNVIYYPKSLLNGIVMKLACICPKFVFILLGLIR